MGIGISSDWHEAPLPLKNYEVTVYGDYEWDIILIKGFSKKAKNFAKVLRT